MVASEQCQVVHVPPPEELLLPEAPPDELPLLPDELPVPEVDPEVQLPLASIWSEQQSLPSPEMEGWPFGVQLLPPELLPVEPPEELELDPEEPLVQTPFASAAPEQQSLPSPQ